MTSLSKTPSKSFEALLDQRAKSLDRSELRALKKILSSAVPGILDGARQPSMKGLESSDWVRRLMKRFKTLEASQRALRIVIRTLLDAEDHLGWQPARLPRLLVLQSEKPAAAPSDLLPAARMPAIQRALATSIQTGRPSVTDLYLSALAFGSLPGTLKEFVEAARAGRFRCVAGQWILTDDRGYIRWFADPVTNRMMHLRPPRGNDGEWKQEIALSHVQLGAETVSVSEIIRIVRAHQKLAWPATLAHPSSCELGMGLHWQQFHRLATGRCMNIEPHRSERPKPMNEQVDSESGFTDEGSSLPASEAIDELIRRLLSVTSRARFSRELRRQLTDDLRRLSKVHHPVVTLYKFAFAICQDRHPRTVRERLKPIIEGFLPLLARVWEPPRPMTSEHWAAWLSEYLDTLPRNPAQRKQTITALRMFRKYLIQAHRLSPADSEPIAPAGKHPQSPDVNIVTFHEMDCYLQSTVRRDNWSRKTLMEAAAAILGFYCGLRASEIRNRTIGEFRIAGDRVGTIIVQPNQFGATKSRHSTRIVPASNFIPEEYAWILPMLINWRLSEARGNTFAPLFATLAGKRFHRDTFLGPVMQNLRRITRDPNLRFHHLRHSFANWLYLRLMAFNNPAVLRPGIHAFTHKEFSQARIRQLADSQLCAGHMLGDRLKCVTIRLGHINCTTTLNSYLHVNPWLRYACSLRDLTRLNPETLAQALGMARSSVYQGLQTGDVFQRLDEWSKKPAQSSEPECSDFPIEHPADPLREAIPDLMLEACAIPIDQWDIPHGLIQILRNMGALDGHQWAARLERCLAGWKRQQERAARSRKQILRRPAAIHPPRSWRHRQETARIFRVLESACDADDTLKRLVELFRDFGSNKNFVIRASDFQTARDIIRGLERLGYSRTEHISINLALPLDADQELRQKLRERWSRETRIPTTHILFDSRRIGKNDIGTAYVSARDWSMPLRNGAPTPHGEHIRYALEMHLRVVWSRGVED